MGRKDIKNYFNSHYDEYERRTVDRFRRVPNFLNNYLERGARILDVGCGKGEFLEYLKKTTEYDIYGIDISRAMLTSSELEKNLVIADAGYLPFKSDSFDFVYIDTVLHHTVGNTPSVTSIYQRNIINEAKRVLKDGAFLAIQELYFEFCISSLSKIAFYYLEILNKLNISPYPNRPPVKIDFKSKKEWKKFLSNLAGSKPLEINIYPLNPPTGFKITGIKETGNIMLYFKN